MKKQIVYLALSILTLFFMSFTLYPAHQKWKLVWEENFDGNTLDTTRWSKIPRGKGGWQKHMTDFDSCYSLKEGKLNLWGIKNTTLKNDTAPFLTGGVWTKHKVSFQNGRIEIRAKLGEAPGAWPAIWMLSENKKWPDGGEIDIMEHLNSDSIAYQTIHSHYSYVLGIKEPKNGDTNKLIRNDYNIYALELHPDSLVFFVNDNHTFTYPRIETDQKGQFPFDAPFYLLIDMQLGGSWVGDIDAQKLPVKMQIDWVRFYQQE